MLPPECLEALDYTIWLGSEAHAGRLTHCSQSTICRRARQATTIFKVRLSKVEGEWNTYPDSILLTLERQVHQLYRFASQKLLRLESDHWAGPQLLTALPEPWVHGRPGRVGIRRPMQLLRDRIIDAWITCTQADLPPTDDPTYVTHVLATTPLMMACASDHPLSGIGELTVGDLQQFPSLSVATHHYPNFAKQMQAKGAWNTPQTMQHYSYERWEAQALHNLYTLPINTLSNPLANSGLQPLDFNLSINDCIALVMRRDISELPEVQRLREHLQQQLHALALKNPLLSALN